MKPFLLFTICIILFSCKKNNTTTPSTPPNITTTTYCDTIDCMGATGNALYKYVAQGSITDTNMTNHYIRLIYTHKDSVYNSTGQFWTVRMHYNVIPITFNKNLIEPSFLTVIWDKGSNPYSQYLKMKPSGVVTHGAVFQRVSYYH